MTVSSTLNKIIYSGNGITTNFTFPFPGVAASDIQVFITDSAGSVTQLATNLYSVVLNAPISPNPTGVGGSVNYPLSGPALAIGNTLTILRTIPLTQPTSLSAQGTMYQTVIEAALDNLTLEVQQINELVDRQITVAVSDPSPADLPGVAQRANMLMGFDSNGDPAAVALPAGSVSISAPMIPVVGAASLGAARTLLGLGSIATLGVGSGLVSDGTNVNITSDTMVVAVNHSITAAENNSHHFATVGLTVSLDPAASCFDGWSAYITALTDYVAVAIDPADSFLGMPVGQSFAIPPGASVAISTDGINTWFVSFISVQPANTVTNLELQATVAANNLTISVKDKASLDPSTSSPVILTFKGGSGTLTAPIFRAITSPLSIVVPNGASLGTTGGASSRIWVLAFDDNGTIVLGVYNAVNSTNNIKCFAENTAVSGTGISAGATAAQTYYTSSAVTSKYFIVLGSIEIGEAVAGQWSAGATGINLFGPGSSRPGDIVQTIYATDASATVSVGVTPTGTNLGVSITPQYPSSRIKVRADGNCANPAGAFFITQIYRNAATPIGNHGNGGTAAGIITPANMFALDFPNVAVATTYSVFVWASGGGNAGWNSNTMTTAIYAEEIYV